MGSYHGRGVNAGIHGAQEDPNQLPVAAFRSDRYASGRFQPRPVVATHETFPEPGYELHSEDVGVHPGSRRAVVYSEIPHDRCVRRGHDANAGASIISLDGLLPDPPTSATRRPQRGAGSRRTTVLRRRRTTAMVAVVGVAAALTIAVLHTQRHSPRAGAPVGTHGGVAVDAHPGKKPSSPVTLPQPPFAVGSTTVDLTDGPRVLPTVVRYPALTAGSGAAPLRAGGPWPLIVFSQGYDIAPESYSVLLAAWAASGFVVADPAYPYTSPGSPGGLDENDIVNHPSDLRSVVTALTSTTSPMATGDLLAGMVNASAVGLAGHSDGGDVTDALVGGSCCADRQVTAAIMLSGAELESFGGTFQIPASVPVLVVQGDDDTINPPACSEQIYDSAAGTRYYLDLVGAGHRSPYLDPAALAGYPGARLSNAAAYRQIVRRTTTAFWEQYLAHRSGGASVATAANEAPPGLSRLTSGPPIPLAAPCPGAPAP